MSKAPNIILDGKTLEGYTITKRGVVRSPQGKELTVTNGRVWLSLDGKRKRYIVKDLIASTYAPVKEKASTKRKPKRFADKNVDAAMVAKAMTGKKEEPKAQVKETTRYKNEIAKPIHDTATKNESFLQVANELKEEGIANHNFMLWLNNPELAGVNPWNPAIKKEIRAAIVTEAVMNPWYFLREIVRVENDKGEAVPLTLTKESAITLFLALNNRSVYTVADKEKKVTDAIEALNAWLALVEGTSDIAVMDVSKEVASASIQRIAQILNRLPRLVRNDLLGVLAVHSTDRLLVERTKSQVRVIPTPMNPTAASNAARGVTANIIHINEFERIKDSLYFLLENTPAFTVNAKRSPNTCARIITTTISDKADQSEFVKRIMKDMIIFTNTLIDNMVELENGEFIYVDLEGYRVPTGEPAEPFVSKFEWYQDRPDVIERALTIYKSVDFSSFTNLIPQAVRENILADGHEGFEEHLDNPEVNKLIEDYTIRRIAQTIVEGLYILPENAYDTIQDTLFACFGVTNAQSVQQLLTTNPILMGRFYNLTYEFMKVAPNVKLVNQVGKLGQLNAEALHLMLQWLAKYVNKKK